MLESLAKYRTAPRIITIWLMIMVILLLCSILYVMQTKGKQQVMEHQAKGMINLGSNMVSDLLRRVDEVSALTTTLSITSERLPKEEAEFANTLPSLIDFRGDKYIAGGGIWPEPYSFAKDIEKRSFFWGRGNNGALEYYDDYNAPDSGYHNEEWYVVGRYLSPSRNFWSRSYVDAVSGQPMVTCTSGIYENSPYADDSSNPKFIGVSTIDLKLEALQSFADAWQKRTGGYVFITDQFNKFITFPKPKEINHTIIAEDGTKTIQFLTVEDLAAKHPLFAPIATIIERMTQHVIHSADQMPRVDKTLASRLAQDSEQINAQDARIMAAIITDPLVKNTFFERVEISDDWLNDEASWVFSFFVPQLYWKVVLVIPESEMANLSTQIFQWLLLFLVIVFLPMIFLTYYLVRWRIQEPLQHIAYDIAQCGYKLTDNNKKDEHLCLDHNYSIHELNIINTNILDMYATVDDTHKNINREIDLLQAEIKKYQQAERLRQEGSHANIIATQVLNADGNMNAKQQPATLNKSTSYILLLPVWSQVTLVVANMQQWQMEKGKATGNYLPETLLQYLAVNKTRYLLLYFDQQLSAQDVQFLHISIKQLQLMGMRCILIGMSSEVAGYMATLPMPATTLYAFANIADALRWVTAEVK
ncbi:MAG: hypothetical protein R8L53_02805 [Mariprofundales bacterium]